MQRVSVNFEALEEAMQWVSSQDFCNIAYVERASGKVLLFADPALGEIEEQPPEPEDLDDDDHFLPVLSKQQLGLGQPLIFEFINEQLPQHLETVRGFFRQRGAYRRFKDFLHQHDKIDAWHQYEAQAQRQALQEWLEEEGMALGE